MSYYEAIQMSLEPPCYSPIGYCHKCGNDIFAGDEIYEIGDEWYCEECIHSDSQQGYEMFPNVQDNKKIGCCYECDRNIMSNEDVTKVDENLYCEGCITYLKKRVHKEDNLYVE